MNIFKHYSEEHNPNCTRLYWKTDKEEILDILYNKLDIRQINRLMTICREKNNPNHGKWTDKPNRTPVMVRTSGKEFFVTLNNLKKAYYKTYGIKDYSKLDYYLHFIYNKKKEVEGHGELKEYYNNLWKKILYAKWDDEELDENVEKEIKRIIDEENIKDNKHIITE